jgi:hypothetical protein
MHGMRKYSYTIFARWQHLSHGLIIGGPPQNTNPMAVKGLNSQLDNEGTGPSTTHAISEN